MQQILCVYFVFAILVIITTLFLQYDNQENFRWGRGWRHQYGVCPYQGQGFGLGLGLGPNPNCPYRNYISS